MIEISDGEGKSGRRGRKDMIEFIVRERQRRGQMGSYYVGRGEGGNAIFGRFVELCGRRMMV